jgi:2-desacetyl-2-hydroxyethyl bacteriochlorophyllide A dehydrogenase
MTMQQDDVRALWYVAPGEAALRPGRLERVEGDVVIRARWSGVSRGTERLVMQGEVPETEYERMRCPGQEGAFPFPVKYGYALVGDVVEGPEELRGKTVFALYPHQAAAAVPVSMAHVLPRGLPPRRAVLAANMETALNAVWDGGVGPGDRVLVVGGGVLGLLIASLAARIAGTEVAVADPLAERAEAAQKLGVAFHSPSAAPGERDVVFHTSATASGLDLALAAAGPEAAVVEASWYGSREVAVSLGRAFHARRLRLLSSQVGQVPVERRARWTTGRRLAMGLRLLMDERLDALITREVGFEELPAALPGILGGAPTGLATVIRYD